MSECYSDHNEDIRTKGSCDYCHGTELDPSPPVLPYGGRVAPNSGHAGSETSEASAVEQDASGATSQQQREVLRFVRAQGSAGATVGSVRRYTGYHHGTASRTLSDLHTAGLLCRLTEVRHRAKVYVLPEYVNGRETEPQGQTATIHLLDDMADLIREVSTEGYYTGNDRMSRALDLLERYDARRK